MRTNINALLPHDLRNTAQVVEADQSAAFTHQATATGAARRGLNSSRFNIASVNMAELGTVTIP
ncbi:hypothetical protein [Sandarakinorhabdus limnophila]|uniref:hypothetical protein n=1 Tax=Sandarakinorhabdus limnophila TaxID=210512 RepID=UPI003137EDE4